MRWVSAERAAEELDISKRALFVRLYHFRKRGITQMQKNVPGYKRFILVDMDFLYKNDMPGYTTTAECDKVMEDIYTLKEKGVQLQTIAKHLGKSNQAFSITWRRTRRFRKENYPFICAKIAELKAQYLEAQDVSI
jgi:biotin operon repressor